LRRQFESFAQLKRGRVSGEFLRKTVEAGHARVNVYANRTEVYHLFARPFYRALGEEDNRNRRSRPPLSIKAKLMGLDYVLLRALGKMEALIQKGIMVRPARLERATFWFVARRSIQLSYERTRRTYRLIVSAGGGGCQSRWPCLKSMSRFDG
jgi:hypothetical protein